MHGAVEISRFEGGSNGVEQTEHSVTENMELVAPFQRRSQLPQDVREVGGTQGQQDLD